MVTAAVGQDDHLVLAVDDEPANRRAVRRALSGACRVATAGSGAEGLAVMAAEPVALVIVDQRMPGMSGAEFLRHTVRLYPAVIRVVLTGYTDVDTLVEAINAAHVYHFLSKPWEALELRQVVRRGLERHAAEADRARLLEELEAACVRARREAEQKSRLLVMAAHELGTPLHILLNAVAFLQEAELPAAARQWAQTALRASDWLARGVAQMNTAARIRERRFPLRVQEFDLAELLDDVVGDLRLAAGQRRLRITTALSSRLDPVVGDPRWVRQAVSNLLTNAVRFTPDGGWVCIEAFAQQDRVVIAVTDSGIGIVAEFLGEIFEPFSAACGDPLLHGSGSLAFGARGLGLGLAMVKEIAEAHGGSVHVTSAPGAGSRFALSLPKSRRAHLEGGECESRGETTGEGERAPDVPLDG